MRDAKLVFIVGAIGLAVNLIGLIMFWEEGGHGHSHGGGGGGHSHGGAKPENSHGGHGHTHSDASNNAYEDKPENQTTNIDVDAGHGHSHDEKPIEKSSYNMNIHGVWLHVLGDALGSVVVMIAAGLIWYVEVSILSNPDINSADILAHQNSTAFSFDQICAPVNSTNSNATLSNTCINPTIQDLDEFIESYKAERMFPVKNFWWFVYRTLKNVRLATLIRSSLDIFRLILSQKMETFTQILPLWLDVGLGFWQFLKK